VAIPLFAIRKFLNESLIASLLGATSRCLFILTQMDFDCYDKYKSKPTCEGENEIPHFIRNDKKECHYERTKRVWQSHIDYNPQSHHEPAECRRGDRILTTTERLSLRAT